MENGNAVGEQFDFRKGVGGKEERSTIRGEDFGFEETPEIRSREGIEAARGFIEEQNLGLMQKGTEEAEALDGAGRERAKLAVKGRAQLELLRENGNAGFQEGVLKMIQTAKKAQIFPASEAGIETAVAAGVIAQITADGTGVTDCIMTGKNGGAARGEKQSCKYPEQCGFAGTIGSKERHRFAFVYFEGDTTKGGRGGGSKGLQEGAPTAVGWRK